MKTGAGLLLLLPLLTGCLSTQLPVTADWPIAAADIPERVATPQFGVTRLSQLVVRAPYDVRAIQVLRADGTLASDPLNRFAAVPSQLLKGPALDALAASGHFRACVGSSSAAASEHTLELTVTELSLDCRTEGRREARAAVSALVLDRDRAIVFARSALGRAEVDGGDFGAGFSTAFARALGAVLSGR